MNASHKEFHEKIIQEWTSKSLQNPPFSSIEIDEEALKTNTDNLLDLNLENSDTLYATRLQQLRAAPTDNTTKDIGQWLIITAVAKYAHLVPLIPRDLFWYFGGDCMHYLGDEEIASFQRLDEEFYSAGESCSYSELRSKMLGLH